MSDRPKADFEESGAVLAKLNGASNLSEFEI
jgi:hypothetical protein